MTKTSRTRPILHDIIAFANTNGGTVYVGVNPNVNVFTSDGLSTAV